MKDREKQVLENDYCDLEPGKICDNCCRCIDNPGKEYNTVFAGFDVLQEEEKLRKLEEEERAAEAVREARRSDGTLLTIDFEDET